MEVLLPNAALIVWGIMTLLLLSLWIITLADILRNNFNGVNDKLIWVLIVLLVPFIGMMLYFFIGRKSKITSAGTQTWIHINVAGRYKACA
jgi:hypothetical protein